MQSAAAIYWLENRINIIGTVVPNAEHTCIYRMHYNRNERETVRKLLSMSNNWDVFLRWKISFYLLINHTVNQHKSTNVLRFIGPNILTTCWQTFPVYNKYCFTLLFFFLLGSLSINIALSNLYFMLSICQLLLSSIAWILAK